MLVLWALWEGGRWLLDIFFPSKMTVTQQNAITKYSREQENLSLNAKFTAMIADWSSL
jgi:hypothetical protein